MSNVNISKIKQELESIEAFLENGLFPDNEIESQKSKCEELRKAIDDYKNQKSSDNSSGYEAGEIPIAKKAANRSSTMSNSDFNDSDSDIDMDTTGYTTGYTTGTDVTESSEEDFSMLDDEQTSLGQTSRRWGAIQDPDES